MPETFASYLLRRTQRLALAQDFGIGFIDAGPVAGR
jgi:hypothetical protein